MTNTLRDGMARGRELALAMKVHLGKCTLWMVKNRENILTGHKATLKGYRINEKKYR